MVVVVGSVVRNLSLPNVGRCRLAVFLQSKMTEILLFLLRGSCDQSLYRASPTTRTTKLVSFEGGFVPSDVGSCWKCSAVVQSIPAEPDTDDGDDDGGGGDGDGRVAAKSRGCRDRISDHSVCFSTCLLATKASGEIPILRCWKSNVQLYQAGSSRLHAVEGGLMVWHLNRKAVMRVLLWS